MNAPNLDDDDELLAELGAAVRAEREVPPGVLAAGRAAFAWRDVDAELAALSYDGALAGVRSAEPGAQPAELRALTFVAADVTIELEVTGDGLFGQLVPPSAGEVRLHVRDGEQRSAELDEVGWFAFKPAPSGMCRLHVRTDEGTSVLTEWIRL
jgi:hypothetical protein